MLKRWSPSWVTVGPGVVVNRPLAVSIKVCSLTVQPVGKELDVKLLIQLLFTSVFPCEVTKTLRVPGPAALMSFAVLPRTAGSGSVGLPVAVSWLLPVNAPQIAGAHGAHWNCTTPFAPDTATATGAGTGPAP